MNKIAMEKTELNKILLLASEYAVLDGGKLRLKQLQPVTQLKQAKQRLKVTDECLKLLFSHGIAKIEYFSPFEDEIQRAQKFSTLSCLELMKIGQLLRSTRLVFQNVTKLTDEEITQMKLLAENLYFDTNLEEDIQTKILNESQVSDNASEKLFSIRREIRLLNERIKNRLADYLSGQEGKYLQDAIVTIRDNRYVLPVRAEYKRNIKGFIHDRSQSGATFFIEPEEVLEMNNELRTLTIDEKEEVERILSELSRRCGFIGEQLLRDIEYLEEIDANFAIAEFCYKYTCSKPEINDTGIIEIEQGRHPLIDRKKVVPVTLKLGDDYRFLLISGPNTGGKTVTLKMVGLFCAMAMCGFFVPCKRAVLSVFDHIFCDIGDLQSIEESLSTFSSHMTNIIHIVNNVNQKSLVLIDELGGGTDPEEGQALAKAVLFDLLKSGCVGVITTHYTALKEFAFLEKGIENACMEFDNETLQPLYRIKLGIPGSSNALGISRRLGLKESILSQALSFLPEDAQKFENIVSSAEKSRILAEETLLQNKKLEAEWFQKSAELQMEKEKFNKEKEKFLSQTNVEARRIIREKTAEAEDLLLEIKNIFDKENISEGDLIDARTLKNKLKNLAYATEQEELSRPKYMPAKSEDIVIGKKVYVNTINQEGIIQNVRENKKEAEVLCGNMRVRVKFSNLSLLIIPKTSQTENKKQKKQVQVIKNLSTATQSKLEINVIGLTVQDAIFEIEAFLDSAILSNLEEVRIVHGMGTGKLRAGIHQYLRKTPYVSEYRLGKYGEGDTGVTIVKLK